MCTSSELERRVSDFDVKRLRKHDLFFVDGAVIHYGAHLCSQCIVLAPGRWKCS